MHKTSDLFTTGDIFEQMKQIWDAYDSEIKQIRVEQDSCVSNMMRRLDETEKTIGKMNSLVADHRKDKRLKKDPSEPSTLPKKAQSRKCRMNPAS